MAAQVPKPDLNAGLPVSNAYPIRVGPRISSIYTCPKLISSTEDNSGIDIDIDDDVNSPCHLEESRCLPVNSNNNSPYKSPMSDPGKVNSAFQAIESKTTTPNSTSTLHGSKLKTLRQLLEEKLDAPIEISYEHYKHLRSGFQTPQKIEESTENSSLKSCLRQRSMSKTSPYLQVEKKVNFLPNVMIVSYSNPQ